MRRYLTLIALLTLPAFAQQKLQAPDLIALAKSGKPELRVAITGTFDSGALQDGTAWIGHGPDFFFAVETDIAPSLVIDEAAAKPMKQIAGSKLWYATLDGVKVGTAHTFHYMINGAAFGRSRDMPAFGPMSYAMPGSAAGNTVAEAHSCQQDIRRNEE
jgi:hypothetical protein